MRTISYLMNCIERSKLTPLITTENLLKADYPITEFLIADNGSVEKEVKEWQRHFATIWWDREVNIGNSKSLNQMLSCSIGDIIVIAGNDIKFPDGWLSKAVDAIERIPDTGIVGFYCVMGKGEDPETVNGIRIRRRSPIFGAWVYSREVFEKVGFFSVFSKYGLWDSDYALRVKLAGFQSYYLDGFDSQHLVTDHHEKSPYRLMKNEEMHKAAKAFDEAKKEYSKEFYYKDINGNLIAEVDFVRPLR